MRDRLRKAAGATDLTWRYVLNTRSAVDHRLHGGSLAEPADGVVRALRRDGIAVIPADRLLGPQSLHAELVRAAAGLEAEWSARLAEMRAAYVGGAAGGKQKPFSITLLAADELPKNDIYTRFALQEPVVEVANAYFGMYTVLTHCNVWHNFVASGEPTQSQLWHRDPEDRHILKVFYYLSDVDEGAGPFTYARGSHRHPERVAPHSHLDGATPRSNDDELARMVPRERWLTACGPAGTMVFADTRGYHKGGWARQSDRIVYVCEFLSSAAHGIPTRDRRSWTAGAANSEHAAPAGPRERA